MKHLKITMGLLFFAALFVSCEKETINPAENSVETQSFKSVLELMESGVDIESYVNSLPKQSNKNSNRSMSKVPFGLEFFTSPGDFSCSGLPTEDFEEGRGIIVGFPGSLDEYTDNNVFQLGEILPGVSISSVGDGNSQLAFVDGIAFGTSTSKAVFADIFVDYLVIDFTASDVTSVSMNVIAWQDFNPETTVDVYGSSGLIGSTIVTASSSGVYLGIDSDEPIVRITLNSFGGAEGVDDLSFGTCDSDGDGVSDNEDNCPDDANADQANYDGDLEGDVCDADDDNDGCLDGDDPKQFSNIEATVDIDGCDSGVENRVTSTCGYTMSDMIDALEAGNYKNHGAFVRTVAKLTKSWVDEGLISQLEKDAIMSCAGGANIP